MDQMKTPPDRFVAFTFNQEAKWGLQNLSAVTELPTSPLTALDLSTSEGVAAYLVSPATRVICLKNEHNPQLGIQALPLPDTRPARLEGPARPGRWTDEQWENRIVLGDNKLHMFIKHPRDEDDSDPMSYPISLVLPVATDSNGRWFYENADHQMWSKLNLVDVFTPKMSSIFESIDTGPFALKEFAI